MNGREEITRVDPSDSNKQLEEFDAADWTQIGEIAGDSVYERHEEIS